MDRERAADVAAEIEALIEHDRGVVAVETGVRAIDVGGVVAPADRDDLRVCPRCAGPVRVLAAITDPAVVAAILTHLDLPTEPPQVAAARAPPQVLFWPGGSDRLPDLDAHEPA